VLSTTTFNEERGPSIRSPDRKILVVDDEELVTRTVAAHLKVKGFTNVKLITDARRVMRVVGEYRPDLILLDIFMPYFNGLELLSQIRSNSELDNVIVLMLSSAGQEEKFKSLELGALGFIEKPASASQLFKAVTRAFQVAHRLGLQ
jgi:PleD family two-component response regulator